MFLSVKLVVSRRFDWGWMLMLVGGWGNWLQRLAHGCVMDDLTVPFLPLKNNYYDWLIFGGMVLIIRRLWKK